MNKRKVASIHVAHPAPKRARIHQYDDSDIADIATAIMFDIFTYLPTEYKPHTTVQIYNGINQYIDGVKRELAYDDIPFDDLTTDNFEQAGTAIIREAEGGILIFYAVARQAIITIQKGRAADLHRRRYNLLPPSNGLAGNTRRVFNEIQDRSRTPQRQILSEQEITDRVTVSTVTHARPTHTELNDFKQGSYSEADITFFRKFWCNDIEYLTPEIARSLIGQDVFVMNHDKDYGFDLDVVHFDGVRTKMAYFVERMKIINEVSPSMFEVQFRSENVIIYPYYKGVLCYSVASVPFYIFIRGQQTR